jgi:hypothetical protein
VSRLGGRMGLGWPAFLSLLGIFVLMVMGPALW